MAQLVVRNLSDEIKVRLKRRAEKHGRSLEAEVRDILASAADDAGQPPDEGAQAVARLIRRQREIGVTKADVDDLNEDIAELRRDQHTHDIAVRRK